MLGSLQFCGEGVRVTIRRGNTRQGPDDRDPWGGGRRPVLPGEAATEMARCRRHALLQQVPKWGTEPGCFATPTAPRPPPVLGCANEFTKGRDPSRLVARGVRLDFWIRCETIQIRRFFSAFGSGQIAVTGVVAQEWPALLRPRQTLRKQAKGVRNETEFGPCSNRLSLNSKLRCLQ